MNLQVKYLGWGKEVFAIEEQSIREVANSLDEHFAEAVTTILDCRGRVIITGMGKSGHIGRKIAASMASTGTPAYFVHPAEAGHGDLGMIVDGDVLIALSNSGESEEILALIPAIKRKHVQLICITGKTSSSMAKHADIHLCAHVSQEACPLGLAPTSSTTAVMVLGDALTVALLRARQFTPEDFALSHPAGSLGKRLLLTVADVMHGGQDMPLVQENTPLREAIVTMSEKGLGMLLVVNTAGELCGLFTDGDLRRLFQDNQQLKEWLMADVMGHTPKTISADRLATEALKIMQENHVNGLAVIDANNRPVGALNMHDLLQARIV
ncbi:KpsF/GutQ family sugar-phosphate isomerase [Snodgrassella sp. ESL0324]|uniref:KpsF/GutQ family sugar-phosphate isomerase n=1 Tax=Snodgrassella sp. ESL0324 TaxID=2705033 RepID=UPI00158362B0|nr:KpsF/GutQ family sugar-phosphate isomerase [Snodgrassella sp. ESL0324]NUF09635.1 KpsF/GutQ family sugar-phosphate isomerase [Snodgrassella sp. ESL0324]